MSAGCQHQPAQPTLLGPSSPTSEPTRATVLVRLSSLRPMLSPAPLCPAGITWPVKEVALAHVCDVQALQQQHKAAEAGLADVGHGAGGQALFIEGL